MVVLLPAPLGPRKAATWPRGMENETSRSAAKRPKYLVSPTASIIRTVASWVCLGVVPLLMAGFTHDVPAKVPPGAGKHTKLPAQVRLASPHLRIKGGAGPIHQRGRWPGAAGPRRAASKGGVVPDPRGLGLAQRPAPGQEWRPGLPSGMEGTGRAANN